MKPNLAQGVAVAIIAGSLSAAFTITMSDKHDGVASCIVPREEWNASQCRGTITSLPEPVKYVVITHTVQPECNTRSLCENLVRVAQLHHFNMGFSDIAYNFLIGSDGCTYIGRGWDEAGAHSKGFNSKSIGLAFIGEFSTKLPPVKQMMAAKQLLEEGVKLKKLTSDYKLFAHNQVVSTQSPGEALTNHLKTWPHWAEFDPKKDSSILE